MNFTIHKHLDRTYRDGVYTIDRDGKTCGPLVYAEMLGVVAKLLLQAKWPPYPFEEPAAVRLGPVYSLHVALTDRFYTVRREGMFLDSMGGDETLGFIAAYTLTDGAKQLFGGMRTYEQWAGLCWNCDRPIAGLITHQPEHVA